MKPGVLLINLGSPDSPSVPDVRRYLAEFLMDGRVLDVPWIARFFIVYFGILPSRPKQSAEAYHSIWTREGSPLVVTSKRVEAQLKRRLPIPVELAMRYRNPAVPAALDRLSAAGVEELLVFPLFPHYAMSSFETAVEWVKTWVGRKGLNMRVKVMPPYYEDRDYIAALTASAQPFLETGFDHLLFSFHGLPERQLRKSDPTGTHCLQSENCCEKPSPAHSTCYRAQCFRTVKAFVERAGIPARKYSVAFQSRLGRDPWLKPYADLEIERLAREGLKTLRVICPAFVSDCLETLEEMGIRGKQSFLTNGGKDFELIPCLNEHPLWLAALEKMIQIQLSLKRENVPS